MRVSDRTPPPVTGERPGTVNPIGRWPAQLYVAIERVGIGPSWDDGIHTWANGATGDLGAEVATEILADSPDLYWPLDETSGTTANDASGHGRHGLYIGGPTLDQGVDQFHAPLFDGVDDVAFISFGGFFMFAWEVWWRRTVAVTSSMSPPRPLLSAGGINQPHLWLGSSTSMVADEVIALTKESSADVWAYTSSSAILTANVWHHIACRWTGAGYQILYDGVPVGNAAAGPNAQSLANSGFSAGRDASSGGVFFDGYLAHVAMWMSAAPSEARFVAHYDAGVP